jgi:hypothetical protein
MSNYIYLNDSHTLPLADREWYWYDIKRTVNSYDISLQDNLTEAQHKAYMFSRAVNVTTAYNRFDKTSYPVKLLTNPVYNINPDFTTRSNLSFDDVTIKRANELLIASKKYNRTFVFYSGGIDSTTVLSAIIKYWSPNDLSCITIVLNQHSIDENPNFYHTYIKDRFTIASTNDYFNEEKLDNNSLYVTGDLGDPLMSHDGIADFDKEFPGVHSKPFRKNVDSIVKYFAHNTSKKEGIRTYIEVCKSLASLNYEVETVYDFLWFINFAWGWDVDIYQPLWYWRMGPNTDTKRFLEENFFLWFNTKEYQDWSINTIGTDLKISGDLDMSKYALKKFIYEFNRDSDYFKHKMHEGSISKNRLAYLDVIFCGVDSEYNFYCRTTR